VFPDDVNPNKRGLVDEEGSDGAQKRRRVLSFNEFNVDDSEGEEEDFLLTATEGAPAEEIRDTEETGLE